METSAYKKISSFIVSTFCCDSKEEIHSLTEGGLLL